LQPSTIFYIRKISFFEHSNDPEYFYDVCTVTGIGHFHRVNRLYERLYGQKTKKTPKDLYWAKISPGQKSRLLRDKCSSIDEEHWTGHGNMSSNQM